MQHVSRKLLLAGVLAFGTLTAACGDKVQLTQVAAITGVQSVSVSPQNATINVGTSITLAASVNADATTAKTVSWTTSNSAVATVDQTGKVTGVSAGTVTIIATATADPSKSAGAAIVVNPITTPITVLPSIDINLVTDINGNPVNLANANGQLNVTVNTSGGGLIEVFLSSSCTTNTISSTDVAVASQQATSAQAGQVTLSFNTAQLTASNQARFANGNYCIKTRLTNGTAVVVATNTTPITLNNVNVFRATLAFTSQTGGPTAAVSTTNGFNYNQGTLTVSLSSTVFTSSAPVAGISGYLTRNGEQASAGVPTGNVGFTNATVAAGVATIVFTDTGSTAGVRSIFAYNSLPAGDTLYITSATDASGNSIPVSSANAGGFVVAGGAGVRIDNDTPTLAGAYSVVAPNGYIGAAYAFSSGTTGANSNTADTHLAVPGVGGVTTTYFVGTAGSTVFTPANSCDVTGLTAASNGSNLPNTTATNANQAKVVVSDALGNKTCTNVASSFAGGLFGVDKIAPSLAFNTSSTSQTSTRSVANNTGYNTTTKNFVFTFSDTISGFNPTSPLRGTLVRNSFTSQAAGDCVIGGFDPVAKTCLNALMAGTVSLTGGTNVVGYYTITANSEDQAGNKSAVITRTAAFDNVAPTVGALTQSPAAVDPLGTVTVSASAADNFALTTTRGALFYASYPVFQRVAGNTIGAFGTQVTTGTASVALPNVYRGLQSTDASNVILANTSVPMATITVSDVGRNLATTAATTIATSSAATNIQVGNKFQLISSALDGTSTISVATTNLTARVTGASSDPAFQSQPFARIDFYQVDGNGELVSVGSNTLASVTDNGSGVRTYNYTNSNIPLNPGGSIVNGDTAPVTNTFYAIGRSAAGDAVIAAGVVQTQPLLP